MLLFDGSFSLFYMLITCVLLESKNPFTCYCEAACEEIEYTCQISYSEFPDDGVGKIFKHLFAYNQTMEYQR